MNAIHDKKFGGHFNWDKENSQKSFEFGAGAFGTDGKLNKDQFKSMMSVMRGTIMPLAKA